MDGAGTWSLWSDVSNPHIAKNFFVQVKADHAAREGSAEKTSPTKSRMGASSSYVTARCSNETTRPHEAGAREDPNGWVLMRAI